ncbi:hypothetical protein DXG01_011252 [Tephrocybe rancida]|nr:hypothetical protein DXG01_011252 [Tephrocybe rancida]
MFGAARGFLLNLVSTALCIQSTFGVSVIYEGRAPLTLTSSAIDTSAGPYLTGVKGHSQNASHYSTLLKPQHVAPTSLWNKQLLPFLPATIPTEQAISIKIDNSSVFVPGGGPPQYGFRRTELLAHTNGSSSTADLNAQMETGVTVFHFSIKLDESAPLNYDHEYQIVFIEPNDGTHIFGVQLGSPFTNPTGKLPAADSHSFKVLDHALNILFKTPFSSHTWHNFAVQVDWTQRTLAVFYSKDGQHLVPVTRKPLPNTTVGTGTTGQGDFHFGVLKVGLWKPSRGAESTHTFVIVASPRKLGRYVD